MFTHTAVYVAAVVSFLAILVASDYCNENLDTYYLDNSYYEALFNRGSSIISLNAVVQVNSGNVSVYVMDYYNYQMLDYYWGSNWYAFDRARINASGCFDRTYNRNLQGAAVVALCLSAHCSVSMGLFETFATSSASSSMTANGVPIWIVAIIIPIVIAVIILVIRWCRSGGGCCGSSSSAVMPYPTNATLNNIQTYPVPAAETHSAPAVGIPVADEQSDSVPPYATGGEYMPRPPPPLYNSSNNPPPPMGNYEGYGGAGIVPLGQANPPPARPL